MTNPADEAHSQRAGLCAFPGVECPNERADDPGTPGRPSKYCEQTGPGGANGQRVLHNKGNAWAARRRLKIGAAGGGRGTAVAQQTIAAPTSMARLTLETMLREQLPVQMQDFRDFVDSVLDNLQIYADPEAAAAEVDQVRAETRAQLAAAESAVGEEARRRRDAEYRASEAEQGREEADAAAIQAVTDAELARAETAAARDGEQRARDEAAETRAAADAEIERIRAQAAEQVRVAEAAADERVDAARAEAAEAQRAQITAEAGQVAARDAAEAAVSTIEQLRGELQQTQREHRAELDEVRQQARAERDQARDDHLQQVADLRQSAEQRVDALSAALRSAEQVAASLRDQLADRAPGETDARQPRRDGRGRGPTSTPEEPR